VQWKQAAAAASGYATLVSTPTRDQTSTVFNNAYVGMEYSFRVRACQATGLDNTCSAFSNEAKAATTMAAPSSLTATRTNSSTIALAWVNNAGADAAYFEIEFKAGSSTAYSSLAKVQNTATYNAIALTTGTTYTFHVRACTAFADYGCSGYSNEASATP